MGTVELANPVMTASGTSGHGAELAAYGTLVRAIAPNAVQALTEYSWPGNVRQLQNVLEKLVVTADVR